MLYFLHFLSDGGDIFNLFRYITFRAGGAFFTSLAFGFLFSKPILKRQLMLTTQRQNLFQCDGNSLILLNISQSQNSSRY